jgi:DNA-binding response OmpR family regulator
MSYKTKKILTVDDDEDIRLTVSERLELEGFATVWAKNGQVALDYLKATIPSELPDLIILDYMMPIMNGLEFCLEKDKHPLLAPIPVVMMTAGGNLMSVMDIIDQKATGFMAKPMDDETMISLINQVIGLTSVEDPLSEGSDSQVSSLG